MLATYLWRGFQVYNEVSSKIPVRVTGDVFKPGIQHLNSYTIASLVIQTVQKCMNNVQHVFTKILIHC